MGNEVYIVSENTKVTHKYIININYESLSGPVAAAVDTNQWPLQLYNASERYTK